MLNDLIIEKLGSPGDSAADLFADWRSDNSLTGNDSIAAFCVDVDEDLAGLSINDQLIAHFTSLE